MLLGPVDDIHSSGVSLSVAAMLLVVVGDEIGVRASMMVMIVVERRAVACRKVLVNMMLYDIYFDC